MAPPNARCKLTSDHGDLDCYTVCRECQPRVNRVWYSFCYPHLDINFVDLVGAQWPRLVWDMTWPILRVGQQVEMEV